MKRYRYTSLGDTSRRHMLDDFGLLNYFNEIVVHIDEG